MAATCKLSNKAKFCAPNTITARSPLLHSSHQLHREMQAISLLALLLLLAIAGSNCAVSFVSSSGVAVGTVSEHKSNQKIDTSGKPISRIISKRHHNEKDYAPRLSHQLPSVNIPANKPHNVECPIESQPESEVKWFKDNQLIANQPAHVDLTGSDLMFFQLQEEDAGDYYCQATNYLGSVTSESFKLTVQTSIHDPSIKLWPRQAEVAPDQQQEVEFTCSIPIRQAGETIGSPETQVSWRRNGRRLPVVWLTTFPFARESSLPTKSSRFLARQTSSNEFVLLVARLQAANDDNSTFSCVYKEAGDEVMARESSPSVLRLIQRAPQPPPREPVNLDTVGMGPPFEELDSIHQTNSILPGGRNQTTHLSEMAEGQGRGRRPLVEILADLYVIAKPMLIIFSVLCLVGLLVALQFAFIRRRAHANRYMKHHHLYHHHSGASSASSTSAGGSGGSSGGSSALNCDPVLSSLMSRTLSAPSAASLGSCATGKKYKSYRDHMRKVAAANNDLVGNDFIDAAYFAGAHLHSAQQHAHSIHQQQQQQLNADNAPYFGPPNSSSSAAAAAAAATTHLANTNTSLYNQSLAAREQARSLLRASEHMRSLSNLTSGSGGSGGGGGHNQPDNNLNTTVQNLSAAAGPNSQHNHQKVHNRQQHNQPQRQQQTPVASINNFLRNFSDQNGSHLNHQLNHHLNHYSIIDTNEEENRYEELDARGGQMFAPSKSRAGEQHNGQDQLSPYAVSTICANLPQSQPPPVNSEAMRALNEQFDLNQLMLLDEGQR